MIGSEQAVYDLSADVMRGTPVHFFDAGSIVALLNIGNCRENLDLDAIRPTAAVNTREGFEQVVLPVWWMICM